MSDKKHQELKNHALSVLGLSVFGAILGAETGVVSSYVSNINNSVNHAASSKACQGQGRGCEQAVDRAMLNPTPPTQKQLQHYGNNVTTYTVKGAQLGVEGAELGAILGGATGLILLRRNKKREGLSQDKDQQETYGR